MLLNRNLVSPPQTKRSLMQNNKCHPIQPRLQPTNLETKKGKNLNSDRSPQIPRVVAHEKRVRALGERLLLGRRIPVADILAAHLERDGAFRILVVRHLFEAAQLPHRLVGGGRVRDVELGDFGAIARASIGERRGNGQDGIKEVGLCKIFGELRDFFDAWMRY
ncbi:hypothetical protein BKA81DRAFT_360430 [Phyllosticta paracitricarpa]